MTKKELINKQLPRLPSDLIDVALHDLYRAEKDPLYEIDMNTWHSWNINEFDDEPVSKCEICLAGAVIAGSLKADLETELTPDCYAPATAKKLNSLDYFRSGNIRDGLEEIGFTLPAGWKSFREYPEYHYDPNKFKAYLRRLVIDLRTAEL